MICTELLHPYIHHKIQKEEFSYASDIDIKNQLNTITSHKEMQYMYYTVHGTSDIQKYVVLLVSTLYKYVG